MRSSNEKCLRLAGNARAPSGKKERINSVPPEYYIISRVRAHENRKKHIETQINYQPDSSSIFFQLLISVVGFVRTAREKLSWESVFIQIRKSESKHTAKQPEYWSVCNTKIKQQKRQSEWKKN